MLPSLIHGHHNRYLEDLPFWLGLAQQTGDPLLELGCGTGRVLIPLAEAGYSTIGLDYDLAMLRFLLANISQQTKNKPVLVASDICKFNLAAQFPLIILPCNTYSAFDGDHRKACLGCVRRHLIPGGIFAVSLPNPALLHSLPARSAPEIEDEFIHLSTGNPVQVSSSWQRTKGKFKVTWSYDHLLPDGNIEHRAVRVTHQLTSLETYVGEIKRTGLWVRGTYGDFDRSAYTADSPQLILLVGR